MPAPSGLSRRTGDCRLQRLTRLGFRGNDSAMSAAFGDGHGRELTQERCCSGCVCCSCQSASRRGKPDGDAVFNEMSNASPARNSLEQSPSIFRTKPEASNREVIPGQFLKPGLQTRRQVRK
jgi:hypothetical protein